MRECKVCHVLKPLSEYDRAPHLKEFRKYKCKACEGEYMRQRYQLKRDEIDAKKKTYRLANYEHVRKIERASERKWYENNKQRHHAWTNARNKVRRKTDPAFQKKKCDLAHIHYLKKRYGSLVGLAALFDSQLGLCANPYCQTSLKDGCHVDHIMPIALGGTNDLRNLQFLCPSCNHRKTKLHPDEWLERERKRSLES